MIYTCHITYTYIDIHIFYISYIIYIYIPSIIFSSSIIFYLSSVHPSVSPTHPPPFKLEYMIDYDPGSLSLSLSLTNPALAMSLTLQRKSRP